MSSLGYPLISNLPGQSIEVQRSYLWKTFVQEALSGKQSALSGRVYPLLHYELSYNVLRDVGAPGYGANVISEIALIASLHNQMQGRVDTFLFTDPDFNTVTADRFGVSDGVTTTYQLTALYTPASGPYATLGALELVQNLSGTPVLFDNGTVISSGNYSIGATGIVTFASGHVPVSGHTLTWSGSFYYRCRFDDDALVYKKFMNKLWSLEVKFTSVKL